VLGVLLLIMNWRAEAMGGMLMMPSRRPHFRMLVGLLAVRDVDADGVRDVCAWWWCVQGLGSKILTVVAVVISLMLLTFVIITWALIWRHPKSTRQAVGLDDNYCDRWEISVR
jgi:hypothetical protein